VRAMSQDHKELLLREILTKLDALLSIMKIAFMDNIEAVKERSFARSEIKKRIYELCDGRKSVDDIAGELKKSTQYIRVYLTTLEEEGLVVRKGNTYEATV
jgi:predicted Rossmann fold nucleotide-binding protein DprA/Smf involved in DNA uptake